MIINVMNKKVYKFQDKNIKIIMQIFHYYDKY